MNERRRERLFLSDVMEFPKTLRCWFLGLLILCVSGVMLLLDNRYDVAEMLRIELADNVEALFAIIGDNNYSESFLKKCLFLDYFFATGFTILFSCSARMSFRPNKRLGQLARFVALFPGFLDISENTLFWIFLENPHQAFEFFPLYRIGALLKFIFLMPCLFMAFCIVGKLIRQRKNAVS